MILQDIPDNWQHDDVNAGLALVKRFKLAIDCGAHRGVITRLLATRFEQVVAIEPSELASHIVQPNVTVIQKAIGDRAQRVGMAHGKHNTGQRHVVEGDVVEMITLDSLGLAPDFIKIDVEGMEWHVLVGGEQTIRTHKPVIMFEENGLNQRYGIHDGEVGALLSSWGARRVLVTRQSSRDEDWFYSW
jgi:FkbM family methyltransferase